MKNRPPLPDSLTLSEAAQAMTERTGMEWTDRHILGRAVHHEIQISARIGRSVRLVRSQPAEDQKNEIVAPAGSLPPLSAKAVRALLNAGEAGFDGWEHPRKTDFFGEPSVAWMPEWELAPDEVPPVVRLDDCRVSAAGVLQLSGQYMQEPQTETLPEDSPPGSRTLTLPHGTTHLRFDRLPSAIAAVLWPLSKDSDEVRAIAHGGAQLNLEAELKRAVRDGSLRVLDSLTLGPHPLPRGAALDSALVSVEDLRVYMTGRLTVVVNPAPATQALDVTPIGLVAKEAALREHPPVLGESDLRDDIRSAMRETTEKDFLKRLSEYLKLGKLRAVNPYNSAPFDPCLPYLDASDPVWSLTHAERERALELLGQLVHMEEAGHKLSVLQSSGANAAAAEEVRKRHARGFFTLREVAQLLADAHGLNAAKLLASLISSYHENDLTVRDPDTEAPLLRDQPMRDFFCWVTPEDVNTLLETVWRVSYRFAVVPAPEAAPVAKETAKERRARRLAIFEAEEKRGKRGALQRVADAEKIDRANLSKELGKAREERDGKNRAGNWEAQLVRTGKRIP